MAAPLQLSGGRAAGGGGRAAGGRGGLGRAARITLVAAGGILVAVSCLVGSEPISAGTVGRIFLHEVTGGAFPLGACGSGAVGCSSLVVIVWDVRIPAILLALGVGASLGLSGATLQGIFRNPLADPYLLGLSSGATVGVAVLFVLNIGLAAANVTLPFLAFVGAIATGGVILLAAGRPGSSIETLLLTGVALSALLSAVLSFLLLYNPFGNLEVSYWLLGGLFGATWNRDGIVFGGLLVTGALVGLFGRSLNLLQLGPEVAQSLGVDGRRVRARLLLLASFATALAVAFAGVIGFVGLVSPHVVRRLVGPDYRKVLPGSALVGAAFLLCAHDLSQIVLPGSVLPVGIFTSFAGAPFFLYLLYRQRHLETFGRGRA
ncbi:MAG TPA: iron ABC transporter permease [Thermoplasmata archaeon]|nr:iron ABC transporter permease [Thermoplasmata archaeon]